ncbi:MAG: hypothetical protein Q8J66_00750 [Methylotenera sp.]|nr:hypothetical protein [Methylotenera sp.]
MNYVFIDEFLEQIRSDLKRISYRTNGEIELEDLENETYFLLNEFSEKYERKPNKFNIDDQKWVLSRLFNKFIKWTDHNLRNAVRIHSLENDDGESWLLELPAPENSSPLAGLLFEEELSIHQTLLENSYSEAKAYVVTFDNFNQDEKTISSYFYITSQTLNKRFGRALILLGNQPSLFDSIETIDDSFNPVSGKPPQASFGASSEKIQLAWSF